MTVTSAGFRPDIQGLRALAVLLVVIFHAGLPLSGGFIGVDVFFVISGYVITALLLREQQQSGRIDLQQFYRRRILRLLPALALTISVTLLISAFVLSPYAPQLNTAAVGAAGLVFGANIVLSQFQLDYFAADLTVNPLTHLWSLAVEGQLYLFFPFLLRSRHRTVLLAGVSLLSFAWMLLAPQLSTADDLSWLIGYYATPGRIWQFGLGALAVLVTPPLFNRRLAALGWFVAAILLIAGALLLTERDAPGPLLLLPSIAAALLLITTPHVSRAAALLGLPLLRALGDRSYSWYLWHWPLIVFADLLWPSLTGVRPLAALVSLIPAVLSYRLVEHRLRHTAAPAARRNLGLLIAAAALSCLLVPAGAVLWWQPRLLPAERIIDKRPAVADSAFCRAVSAGTEVICTEQGTQRAGTPVYLIGDSQAEMLLDAVSGAAAALDRPFYAVIKRSCPLPAPPGRTAACSAAQQRVAAWLAAARPGDVILAQNRLPGSRDTDPAARVELLVAALTMIDSGGHRLVFVNRIPMFVGSYAWHPDRCTLRSLLRTDCGPLMPLAAADRRNADALALYRAAAARLDAALLDLGPLVCPAGQCRPMADGQRRYADANHLTRAFAATLAPSFSRLLSAETVTKP